MTAPVRSLACTLTLAAMLSPWATVVWTVVHLALGDHHHEAVSATDHREDAAAVLHGHHHHQGIPAHSHDTTAAGASQRLPPPTLTVHLSVTGSITTTPATEASFVPRLEPSPPQRVPIILRI